MKINIDIDITSKANLYPVPNNKRFIIYAPGFLNGEISVYMEEKLKLSNLKLCSTFKDLKRNWKEDNKSIVITTIYHRINPNVDKKISELFQNTSANVIIIGGAIDLNKEDWKTSFYRAIMFFDDLSRPLNTIILVGISHTEYYGHPTECEIGQCFIQFKLITPFSKIEPGFIYGYKFDGEDIQGYARFHEADVEGYYRLAPDRKITKQIEGSLKYHYRIPRGKIRLNSKVYFEVWRF